MRVGTQVLRDLVNAASALKEQQMNIEQNEEGWEIRILPPAKIDMLRLRIPAERFEGYAPGDAFAMDVAKLQKALNVCGDTVDIEIADRVVVRGEGVRMTIPMIVAEEAVKWPVLNDMVAEVVMSSDEIRRMSDAAPEDAMSVVLRITPEGVVMTSSDDTNVSSAEMTLPADKCVMCEGEARGVYNWLPLRGFLKGVPKGADLDIRTATNYPMVARFETGEGLTGEYMLAPWIEGE